MQLFAEEGLDNGEPRAQSASIQSSLSYYYGGLTDYDQFEAFRHLCRSDQADMEYQAWVRDANHLPKSFQQLSGLNLEDVVIYFSAGNASAWLYGIKFGLDRSERK